MSADPYAYLKWPRLIVFNLNGALSIVATGLAAQSLVNLNHDKATLAKTIPGAKLHVGNVIAATALMTASAGIASIYTAVLGAAITLKWYKMETRRTIRIREALMVAMATLLLVSAIIATVIIVPRSAGASSPTLPEQVILRLIIASGKSIKYRDSLAFDSLIVVWICFGTTLLSFFLAALTSRHIGKYGPEDTTVGHYVSKHRGTVVPGQGVAHGDHATEKKMEQTHLETI
ncbi:hypothetical protein NliqN6_5175 [Naganishia liquefaciens]|uniref:Transmembrane protein n=1 Tax=Naganishia liquefaciens TaxID=104408 RepID=A0A8H3TXR5_9TREE|nr:hypothetical protein NliqN6_5175 [Naganishia liquefaciens]